MSAISRGRLKRRPGQYKSSLNDLGPCQTRNKIAQLCRATKLRDKVACLTSRVARLCRVSDMGLRFLLMGHARLSALFLPSRTTDYVVNNGQSSSINVDCLHPQRVTNAGIKHAANFINLRRRRPDAVCLR